MTKKIISVLLCVLTILSVFVIAPVTSAGAVSYKDNLINSIIENESSWYDKSYFAEKGYYGYGTVEFIDFNFDGKKEFVITYPSLESRVVFHEVARYYDGCLHAIEGDENDGYGGYFGNTLDAYYNKKTGEFKFFGNAQIYESSKSWVQQNFSLEMTKYGGKPYLDLHYYSGKLIYGGKTTYFSSTGRFGDLSYAKAIKSSNYKIVNSNNKTNYVKIGMTTKKIELNKWYSYSTKKKKSLLSESYDAFKLKGDAISTPALPTYESKGNSVNLKWKAVDGAVNYRVYRKSSSKGSWKSVGTTTEAKFTDTTVEEGNKYIYTVRCVSANGKYAVSGYNKTGKTVSNLETPEITKIGNAKDGAKLTWNKVDGAEKYRVYVKQTSGWKAVGNTTSTSFVYKDAQSNQSYCYTVRCTSKSGKTYTSGFNSKGWSSKFIATPVLSKVTSTSDGVKISWDCVVGAENYRVYVKGGEFKKWTKVGDTTDTSFVHLQPASGVKYTYTVACMSADSTERVSSFDSKGLSINYIAAPAITSGEVSPSGIKITWDKVDGAQKYRVFVKSGSKWKKLKDTTALSFTHKNLEEGVSYTYTVRCISSTGKSYTSAYNKDGWTFDYITQIPTEPETQLPTEMIPEDVTQNLDEVI